MCRKDEIRVEKVVQDQTYQSSWANWSRWRQAERNKARVAKRCKDLERECAFWKLEVTDEQRLSLMRTLCSGFPDL